MKQVFNPYLPLYEYVPDGEPHVFDGRLYVYGSHDFAGGTTFCPGDYVLWSAPVDDLTNWRSEGIIYKKTQDPSNVSGKMELWAPDVAKGTDGRYYLYYALSFYPEIGVAVSDSPAGPFEFYGHVKYKDGKPLSEFLPFDPAVLVDDDGRVYLYYGFSPNKELILPSLAELKEKGFMGAVSTGKTMNPIETSPGGMVVELEADMLTMKQKPHMCIPGGKLAVATGFDGHGFFEAASIRKIGATYYLVYSSERGNELCYATSDKPTEGFAYGGTIVSNGDLGMNGRTEPVAALGNNHGGLVEINGEWYIFYHRHTHSTDFSRQGCAEKIELLPNGKVEQVEITSCGLNGGALIARGEYPAPICCYLTGEPLMVDASPENPVLKFKSRITEEKPETQFIADVENGTLIGYKYFSFSDTRTISLKLRGNGNVQITAATDENMDNVIGKTELILSGAQWQSAEISLTVQNGVNALYLSFSGDFNLDFKSMSFA